MERKISLLIVIFSFIALPLLSQCGILSSQVGYDMGEVIRIMVRSDDSDFLSLNAKYTLVDDEGNPCLEGQIKKWGNKWNSFWWIIDMEGIKKPGNYIVNIKDNGNSMASEALEIGEHLLWNKCFRIMVFENLKIRSEQARTGKGWKDCGSDLQEFSSHVVAIDCLCDIYEIGSCFITPDEQLQLIGCILKGSEYLIHLQDKAEKLGLGKGCVIHEDRQTDIVTGNVAKAAMIFARIAGLLKDKDPGLSRDLLNRAVMAFSWIEKNGPVINNEEQIFYPHVHGAPSGSLPPNDQWMTRDLVMMLRASVELFNAGEPDYKNKALNYADKIMKRQVSESENEDGLYGHFYTYDDFKAFGGIKFTEKANIHCGAWSREGRIYNKGGHYPHFLMPFLEMIKLWPDNEDITRWKKCLSDFAYGYFLPACRTSPFLILPSGYYRNEGLLHFSSWYHAHNKIYPFAAILALEFQRFFNDEQFREIAVGNLQWIAGLNCGIPNEDTSKYLSVSMISGIGSRFRGSWTNIPGSVCNGFSAGKQFRINPPSAKDDLPLYFNDEDYIAHTIPFIAALVRFESYK